MASQQESKKKKTLRKRSVMIETKSKCAISNCVDTGDKFITCSACDLMFHYECSKVNPNLLEMLMEDTNRCLTWCWRCDNCFETCQSDCEPTIPKSTIENLKCLIKAGIKEESNTIREEIKAEIKTLESNIENHLVKLEQNSENIPTVVETKLNKLSEELENQNINYNNKFTSYAETTAKTVTTNLQTIDNIKELSESVANISSNMQSQAENETEQKLILAKQLNVCVFNLPESLSSDPDQVERDDITNLKTVLCDKIKLSSEDIKDFKRLGYKSIEKCRPIVIKLDSFEKRTELLKIKRSKI